MRVNTGADLQSAQMGGDVVGDNGTSTGVAATTLTDSGKSWTTNAWAGHAVFTGGVVGHVLSNTGTVLTIDMWHTSTYPVASVAGGTTAGETAASNPATGSYTIATGNVPAFYMGISTNATAPSASHTFLDNGSAAISELWAASGGLNRSRCSYSHTTSATNYVLSKTQQMVAADGSSLTLQKCGWFQHQVTAAPTTVTSGRMFLETAIPSPPTLIPGDSTAFTETVNI